MNRSGISVVLAKGSPSSDAALKVLSSRRPRKPVDAVSFPAHVPAFAMGRIPTWRLPAKSGHPLDRGIALRWRNLSF